MIIIAENFNSSIPEIQQAISDRNSELLLEKAKMIVAAGADYLDINAGIFLEQEAEMLLFLAESAEPAGIPYVVDSPDPDVIEYIINKLQKKSLIINSITLETNRFNRLAPLANKYEASLISLLMDGNKMPESKSHRLEIADKLVSDLRNAGICDSRILLDPMIKPLATDDFAGKDALEVIAALRVKYPEVHITCGLSNISFGLPARKYLNRAFLLQAMAMGLDSAIMNPLDNELMSLLHAAKSLSGSDEYCCDYLEHFRPQPVDF